jgi:putative acetyltransferase
MTGSLIVRRERRSDAPVVSRVLAEAFRRPGSDSTPPPEVALVDALRDDSAWIPALSMVAELDGVVVGACVSTAGSLDGRPDLVVGLGPLAVQPQAQGRGIGSVLVQSSVAAADALGFAAVVLLGSVDYYCRQGFAAASDLRITAPDKHWGHNFQARALTAWRDELSGAFQYAAPFSLL